MSKRRLLAIGAGPPDAGGRAYWSNQILNTRVEALLASLAGSAEFYELVTSPEA